MGCGSVQSCVLGSNGRVAKSTHSPNIVAEEDALVAEVQTAVGDHRMRPGRAVPVAGLLETAMLFVTIG